MCLLTAALYPQSLYCVIRDHVNLGVLYTCSNYLIACMQTCTIVEHSAHVKHRSRDPISVSSSRKTEEIPIAWYKLDLIWAYVFCLRAALTNLNHEKNYIFEIVRVNTTRCFLSPKDILMSPKNKFKINDKNKLIFVI